MDRNKIARELLKLARELTAGEVVMISDLSNWKAYFVNSPSKARGRTDRSIYETVVDSGDTITMGKTIGTPQQFFSAKDKANLREHGIGVPFDV